MSLEFTSEQKAWFNGFKEDLHKLYRELKAKWGDKLTDARLGFEIEARWGERINEEICEVHGFHDAECLNIAVAVAKEAGYVPSH